jgi:transcriptional regulator with XRE-family HTH domain
MDQAENALTKYLRETGENVSKLAGRIGRSPSTLTRALNGERNPSVELARDVERGTGGIVTAAEFMAICLSATSQPTETAA